MRRPPKGNKARTSSRQLVLGAALALVFGVSGCAAGDDEQSATTEHEYRTAFQQFATCMEAAGHPLRVSDDTGTVIDYSLPESAITSGAESTCYTPFQPIDIAWQIQNAYSSAASVQVRECLESAGIQPAGTVEDEHAQLVDAGLDEACFANPPEVVDP